MPWRCSLGIPKDFFLQESYNPRRISRKYPRRNSCKNSIRLEKSSKTLWGFLERPNWRIPEYIYGYVPEAIPDNKSLTKNHCRNPRKFAGRKSCGSFWKIIENPSGIPSNFFCGTSRRSFWNSSRVYFWGFSLFFFCGTPYGVFFILVKNVSRQYKTEEKVT